MKKLVPVHETCCECGCVSSPRSCANIAQHFFLEIRIGNEAVLEFLSTAEEGQLTAPRRLQNALWLSASQNHPGTLDSWASVVVTTQRWVASRNREGLCTQTRQHTYKVAADHLTVRKEEPGRRTDYRDRHQRFPFPSLVGSWISLSLSPHL